MIVPAAANEPNELCPAYGKQQPKRRIQYNTNNQKPLRFRRNIHHLSPLTIKNDEELHVQISNEIIQTMKDRNELDALRPKISKAPLHTIFDVKVKVGKEFDEQIIKRGSNVCEIKLVMHKPPIPQQTEDTPIETNNVQKDKSFAMSILGKRKACEIEDECSRDFKRQRDTLFEQDGKLITVDTKNANRSS